MGTIARRWVAMAIFSVLTVGCNQTPSEGSGSPFQTGSIEASLEGSSDLSVSQTIREPSGAITAYITYTGTCDRVVADVRLSYRRDDTTVTSQEVLGKDLHFTIGPLTPNKPYYRRYPGAGDFTPDAVIFIVSNERCVDP
jgi:hypothetical protein